MVSSWWNISSFSYLFGSKKSQEKSCLPNSFTINILQVTEEILSPTTLATKWTFIDYNVCLFWLIFSVSSPPSLTTMRFPSLGESSKFPMSSVSMQSCSSPTITFFSEALLFLRNRNIFENNTRKIKQAQSANVLSAILFLICFSSSVKKVITKANQIRWLVNWN